MIIERTVLEQATYAELAFRAAMCQSLLVEQVAEVMLADERKHAMDLGMPEPKAEDVRARARVAVYRRLAELAHDHQSHIPEHIETRWQITNAQGDLGEYAWMDGGDGPVPDLDVLDELADGLDAHEDPDAWPYAVLMVPVRYYARPGQPAEDDDLDGAAAALGEVVAAMNDAGVFDEDRPT